MIGKKLFGNVLVDVVLEEDVLVKNGYGKRLTLQGDTDEKRRECAVDVRGKIPTIG